MSERTTVRKRATGSGRLRLRLVAALAASAALVAAAGCNTDPGESQTGPPDVRLYGSDGNMINSFGEVFKDQPGLLNGMRGTTPLTPLAESFKSRLKSIDPSLTDYSYAGEGYDAVVIAALAAETARSTDAPQIAKYVTSVTTRAADGVDCDTPKDCLDALRAGKDIAYRGFTLRRGGLTDRGEPSTAMYGTLSFSRGNRIDDGKTEYVAAGDDGTVAKDPAAPPAGAPRPPTRPVTPLKIGALLPHTGDLAIAGPPLFAAVQLAVREVNEAGGVLDEDVQYLDGDDGTDPKVASATVDKHIAAGVQVIIGAAASGISKAVMPKIVAAQRVMISPSATSDELSTLDDKGFFFRTSPPDTLQSKALADVIMRYGAQRVVLIARNDSYGIGLRDQVAAELKTAGIKADKIKIMQYEVRDEYKLDQFTGQAKDISGFNPDSVLVIGFSESANVIKALASTGMKFHD
jgi:ABC-type branched-subunit amino acid transport system substrate-binding protein